MPSSYLRLGRMTALCVSVSALLLVPAFRQAVTASGLVRIGFCLPLTMRFTKCIDGRIADCTRSRGFNCKTRLSCVPGPRICGLPDLRR